MPPKPPTPYQPSTGSPAAAAFRSQPAEKNFSPAAGDDRHAQVRIVAESPEDLAHGAAGRIVDGVGLRPVERDFQDAALAARLRRRRSWLPHPDQRVDGDRALPFGPDDQRVDVELLERVGMRLGEARDGQRRGDRRVEIADRPAAKALQQRRGLQRKDRRADLILASPAEAARRNRPEARPARRRLRSSSAARTCGSRVTPISSSATRIRHHRFDQQAPRQARASARAAASTSAGGSAGSAARRPPRSCARRRAPSATTG